jgi:sucrose phosphorylase
VNLDHTRIQSYLVELYGPALGPRVYHWLRWRLTRAAQDLAVSSTSSELNPGSGEKAGLTQRDAILITYGDQVSEPGLPPLRTLAKICEGRLDGLIGGVHILPFFPSSSDDGFSVIDYKRVDPALGDWDDIHRLGQRFRLMFDAVINHVSAHSAWFQAFLRDELPYRDYFITVTGNPDLSQVVRPRALPLLTRFDTSSGPRQVWTTFSVDQVDLNYQDPDVLLEIVDTLLFYVSHGAQLIRLDAIAYLWKEIGTACIHLPQTHRIVQLFRLVLDAVAPHVMLITETNVPHEENLSYFGDGYNEAQLVYNFALPPLVLHTLHTGRAGTLSAWAAGLTLPSERTAFFNFLASHDGIGLNPARGMLSDPEIDALVYRAIAHGGLVSYKNNPDGTRSPYELNINYFDALSNPRSPEPLQTQVERFMAAQAIMLSLVGVPGIYFHSLFGSRGWPEGVALTGRNRTVNRQKLDLATFTRDLADPASLRSLVFNRYARLLRARATSPAFHPSGAQRVLDYGEALFALLRLSPDGSQRALCLHNVTGQPRSIPVESGQALGKSRLRDLISGKEIDLNAPDLELQPYQSIWLVDEV